MVVRISGFLYETITGNFECFQDFNFKKNPKKENLFFRKLENSFVVESITIESVTYPYPYKTAPSEANVKTNRMGSAKWTYHKEHSFASIFFIFVKILFQYKNLLQSLDLKYQLPKQPGVELTFQSCIGKNCVKKNYLF